MSFKLSKTAKGVTDYFIKPDHFLQIYKEDVEIEWNSVLYHYLFDNVPYAFKNIPLLYNNVKQYLAARLDIHTDNIRMVGSAQLGFSLAPDKYGKMYNDNSDLDLVVVNEKMFKEISDEAMRWREDFKNGDVKPDKNYKQIHWDDNYTRIPINIGRGFVDVFKVPGFERYPRVKNVYDVMSQLKRDLKAYQVFKIACSSIRIYKDIASYYAQVILNANNAMGKL